MKIAVCGKGGCGKSTVVAVLAYEFQRRDQQVLVVDSDESNSGLHWMLGIENPPKPLIDFVGGKQEIQNKMFTGFTAGSGDASLSLWRQNEIAMDDIPEAHIEGTNRSRLVVTGKIGRIFEGCACPMGVVTREFLKKLRIDDNEMAIVDMEAGIEHFGRGIESSLDAVIVVVEPSLESLSIAEKTKKLTESGGARFAGAVINKIRSEANRKRLIQELTRRNIIELGCLQYHEALVADGLYGSPVNSEVTKIEAGTIVDRLLDVIRINARSV
ncbi:P-loop NTPase [Desulfosarcina widdelii]|nr:P-loop NTPase [Desulfosarcina widdelii]